MFHCPNFRVDSVDNDGSGSCCSSSMQSMHMPNSSTVMYVPRLKSRVKRSSALDPFNLSIYGIEVVIPIIS